MTDETPVKNPDPESAVSRTHSDPVDADDQTWERLVERAGKPVAVMFFSPACAYCRQMEPYFRQFAGELAGNVLFVRLNVLLAPWTAERYGIRSTPTFTVFCEGKPVREMAGAAYPAILKKMIEEAILHGKECAKNSTPIDYDISGYG